MSPLLLLSLLASVLVCRAVTKAELERKETELTRRAHRKRFLGWTPQQIHLSWSANPAEMIVTWMSWWQGSIVEVHYGVKGQSQKTIVKGKTTTFVDPSSALDTTRYIHRATMTNLQAGATYQYFVKDVTNAGTSDTFEFVARPTNKSWQPRYAVYGDFGLINEESLPLLKTLAKTRGFDAVLHNGDFAYDMVDWDGTRGDAWFETVEPITANYAYMTSPGNHEWAGNFSHYRHRFTMPNRQQNQVENLYWSLDVGNVHFVAMDTELYYSNTRARQYQFEAWLRKDLSAANKNRANVPWIIMMGHRPFYCSGAHEKACSEERSPQKDFLENIFCENKVDLIVSSHVHQYERSFPVYKNKVYNGTWTDPYNDPPAPTYLVAGAAGCQEDLDAFTNHPHAYSAFRWPQYGIGILHILNDTHLTFKQYDAKNGAGAAPVDEFTLIRNTGRQHKSICY